jgi:hypothetical protein
VRSLARNLHPVARLGDVVFDCSHPASLARFWAAAVDGYTVAPYDDEELARLRSLGYSGPEEDPGVIVECVEGPGLPRLYFQLVPESTRPQARVGHGKRNHLHLDLRADDVNAEVVRLEALGARRIDIGQGDVAWVVMEDPEGNEFCVVPSPSRS